MDISALSSIMSTGKLQQQVSISVMKMAMNSSQNKGQMINQLIDVNTKTMERSVNSHMGGSIDVKL